MRIALRLFLTVSLIAEGSTPAPASIRSKKTSQNLPTAPLKIYKNYDGQILPCIFYLGKTLVIRMTGGSDSITLSLLNDRASSRSIFSRSHHLRHQMICCLVRTELRLCASAVNRLSSNEP